MGITVGDVLAYKQQRRVSALCLYQMHERCTVETPQCHCECHSK